MNRDLLTWRPFSPAFSHGLFRELLDAPQTTPQRGAQRGKVQAAWTPRVDVLETADGYRIRAEVPGLDPAGLELTLKENELVLRGEKPSDEPREGETWHVTERSYGAFQRLFRFPEQVDADSVSAESKNGLLTITVKKAPEAQARRIAIKDVQELDVTPQNDN